MSLRPSKISLKSRTKYYHSLVTYTLNFFLSLCLVGTKIWSRDLIGRLKASSFSLTLSLRCRYNLPLKTGFTSARGFYIIISMKKVPDLPSVFVKVTENERTCFYQVLMFACPYLFPVIKLVKLYFTYFHRKCQCSAVNYNAPQ